MTAAFFLIIAFASSGSGGVISVPMPSAYRCEAAALEALDHGATAAFCVVAK